MSVLAVVLQYLHPIVDLGKAIANAMLQIYSFRFLQRQVTTVVMIIRNLKEKKNNTNYSIYSFLVFFLYMLCVLPCMFKEIVFRIISTSFFFNAFNLQCCKFIIVTKPQSHLLFCALLICRRHSVQPNQTLTVFLKGEHHV